MPSEKEVQKKVNEEKKIKAGEIKPAEKVAKKDSKKKPVKKEAKVEKDTSDKED